MHKTNGPTQVHVALFIVLVHTPTIEPTHIFWCSQLNRNRPITYGYICWALNRTSGIYAKRTVSFRKQWLRVLLTAMGAYKIRKKLWAACVHISPYYVHPHFALLRTMLFNLQSISPIHPVKTVQLTMKQVQPIKLLLVSLHLVCMVVGSKSRT